jgi:methionyl-tRNA synthetase
MVNKHCAAAVPVAGAFTPEDQAVLEAVDGLLAATRQSVSVQALHAMLAAIWQVVSDTNRYFAAQEPWALRKTDPARMATVLYVTMEALRQVAILCQPVMPEAAERLLALLGVEADARGFDRLGEPGRIRSGTPLPAPEGVFPRYVEPEQDR